MFRIIIQTNHVSSVMWKLDSVNDHYLLIRFGETRSSILHARSATSIPGGSRFSVRLDYTGTKQSGVPLLDIE